MIFYYLDILCTDSAQNTSYNKRLNDIMSNLIPTYLQFTIFLFNLDNMDENIYECSLMECQLNLTIDVIKKRKMFRISRDA